MKEGILSGDIQLYSQVFSLLSLCTDDYLFIYDLLEDKYVISDNVTNVFALEKSQFSNASVELEKVIYPDDFPLLQEDLQALKDGERTVHNLEYRWLGIDGRPVWISCRGQIVNNEQGQAAFLIGRISEIGRKSKIDGVTGLYRENSLKIALANYVLEENVCGYLLQIGIDNFKDINEKYGLEFGDVILANTAQCILEAAGCSGKVYRMNGDEMIVLVTEYPKEKEDPAKELYKKIRRLADQSISEGGYHLFYTISGGSVYFDGDTIVTDKLIEQAGFALHQAKLKGKNTCVRYTQEDYDAYVHTLDVQESLRQDIEDDFRGFELYYQPVVDISKKQILGAEALIRWNSTKFGFMSPAEFVPLLEESGLIIPLGRWIAKTALQQCKIWKQKIPDFRMNVNLSFVQIKKSDALKDILELIEELEVDRKNVMFEVTESGELESGNAIQVLRAFKNQSIHLAIDDFGTGYSNLRYVRNMTFDLLKIDQSFIRNIRENKYDYMVVKQFTELAHALELQVCYEGVETKEDLECVLELNPDYVQGYYFSKPVPASVFEENYLAGGTVI
ncbi:MAG: GGDEF and EAL domain-containing protein [Lachnospiraceae bacterium]|nr:GGDEF and EAL domain-containing protein [Lachnospiraceae bacterium]